MNYYSVEEIFQYSPRMQKVVDALNPRLKSQGLREGTRTSPFASEGKDPFLDVFKEMPEAPLVIAQAHAIVRSWMTTPFLIRPDEAVVGVTRPIFPTLEHFSFGINAFGLMDEAEKMEDGEEKQRLQAIVHHMMPKTYDVIYEEGVRQFGKEEYDLMHKENVFTAGGYQGHTVPDYFRLLEYGLDGMIDYIDTCAEKNTGKDAQDLYEGCRVIVRGMSQWLDRYAQVAEELSRYENIPHQKQYYLQIAENCAWVAHKKPETLYQAVQLMWCLSLWDWVDCIGRADQYLYPFYVKAKQEGDVIPAEDSVASIIFKIAENGVHNLTLAGVDVNGNDATNELTYLMLQILRKQRDTHPRVSVRVHENSPKQLGQLVVQMWSEGMSDPTVVSDENVIPALTRIGVPVEEARTYSMLGCQEIEIPGASNFGCEDGVFNVARVFEYTLNNGRSARTGQQVCAATGEFTSFETFEDFYNAFVTQLKFFTKAFIEMCNVGQGIRAANFAKLVKTPFTRGCLEKGMPHDAGGPVYNFGVVETAGTSAVADSLTAIKKLVFDEKKISAQTLMDALHANFEGYEKERQLLLNKAPKFGNDNEEADAMAVRVLNCFWDEIARYKSVRGDVFTGACSLLTAGIDWGKTTSAMPDGRFAGEPLGNSIGPRPGADKSGVTAMLNSVAKLPLEKGVGGTTLNVVLTTKLLSTPEMREKIADTVKTYLMNGGQMAQITTANLEDLLDAQQHPERHGNLIVRIGGFSVRFVELGVNAQNEIISRYAA